MQIYTSTPEQDDYPQSWLNLSVQPKKIFYIGSPVWLHVPLLAVVGSRTPMDSSVLWMERHLAPFLRRTGVGVVSGGARGIDQLAHQLALRNGVPTVCILPSGLRSPYPIGIGPLLEEIVRRGGAVISEYEHLTPLRKSHFHVRNRWIAGMGKKCLVVEANRRSGSALTASLAIKEGREVASVPVCPMGGQGLGNLALIRDGAMMMSDVQDLLVWFGSA